MLGWFVLSVALHPNQSWCMGKNYCSNPGETCLLSSNEYEYLFDRLVCAMAIMSGIARQRFCSLEQLRVAVGDELEGNVEGESLVCL